MTNAAQVRDLSRLYGSFAALRRVTCTFPAGGLHVLRGENGAGKSTLLRVLAGLVTPTSGTVEVLGGDPIQQRSRLAYMSHASMLYDDLNATENLRYFARLHCTPGACGLCHSSPEMALRAVGLDPSLTRPVGHYSQGMRQRVSMARALIADPQLLLLDEPFSNMDVDGARDLVALLRDFLTWPLTDGSEGTRTIILTTHQHDLVSNAADSILHLHRGAIAETDTATTTAKPIAPAA